MKPSPFIRATVAIALMSAGLCPLFLANPVTTATPVAQPFHPTDKTDIGTLLDTPATKAVVDIDLRDFSAGPQVAMARSLALKQLQTYIPDTFTDEVLAKNDADLAMVAPPK